LAVGGAAAAGVGVVVGAAIDDWLKRSIMSSSGLRERATDWLEPVGMGLNDEAPKPCAIDGEAASIDVEGIGSSSKSSLDRTKEVESQRSRFPF
jgi:hypothetical protein